MCVYKFLSEYNFFLEFRFDWESVTVELVKEFLFVEPGASNYRLL